MRGKGRLAKLLSIPVLAVCGFVIAATVAGGGLFAQTPEPTAPVTPTPPASPTPVPSPPPVTPTPVPSPPPVTPTPPLTTTIAPPTSPTPTTPRPTTTIPKFQGCSQGFWKNHTKSWYGYSPSQKLDSVFRYLPHSLAYTKLSDALKLGGGGLNALMRQAVGALLNAAHPKVNYPLSTSQVISLTNAAVGSGKKLAIESLKYTLEKFNNLGARGFC